MSMTKTFAAADIGSNTAHLLVAATDGDLVMRIDNVNEWIPLGEVVTRHGEVPKETLEMLVLAMKEFRRVATSHKADRFYVFATEGLRMAKNHKFVIERIAKEAGVQVHIISPEQEARFSCRGSELDSKNLIPSVMIEVGGGSVQVANLKDHEIVSQTSLPLGTGRLIAESGLLSPCPDYALRAAKTYINRVLAKSDLQPVEGLAVLSGGVARGLWRALHPDGEKHLSKYELEYLKKSVEKLAADRIISRFNVKPKRAGTLLPGSLVYLALMEKLHISEAFVSTFGVREGAILEMFAGRI